MNNKIAKYAEIDPLNPPEWYENLRMLQEAQFNPAAASKNIFALAFWSKVDKTFGGPSKSLTSKALTTTFRFGLPLPGYLNSQDRYQEQEKQIQDFIYSAYGPLLTKNRTYSPSTNADIYLSCFGCAERYTNAVLASDFRNIIGSFLFVWVYMTILTGFNFFVSTMGMFQIFVSEGIAVQKKMLLRICKQRHASVYKNSSSMFILCLFLHSLHLLPPILYTI